MRFTEICLKLLRWGIYASLFVPLIIFSDFISPFHFGKAVVFRSLVELMAVIYILLLLVGGKKYLPRWTPIVITFTIFTGVYGLATLTAVDFKFAFWGTLERMGGFFSFLHFWAWFVILVSIFRSNYADMRMNADPRIADKPSDADMRMNADLRIADKDNQQSASSASNPHISIVEKDWIRLLRVSVFVGFLSILFAYGQRFKLGDFFVGWRHGSRVIGTIGNPALFAGYLLFILFLAAYLLLTETHRSTIGRYRTIQKGFYVLVLILGIPVLHMTAVRGSIIAFWSGLVFLGLFFLFGFKSNKKVKTVVFGGLILIVLFACLVLVFRDSAFVQNTDWLRRLTDISFKTRTLQTRLWSWESGWQGFKERPILGWGPENFALAHAKYFNPGIFVGIGSETIWDRAHNIVLELLTTMGVFGFLSYFSIFGFVVWGLIKKIKSDFVFSAIFLTIIFVYLIHNSFIFDTTANYLMFFLVLGYINYRNYERNYVRNYEQKTLKLSEGRKVLIIILGFILGFLAILVMYKTNIEPAFANYACTRAILAERAGKIDMAIDKYKEALSYKTYQGKYEIRQRLVTFVIKYNENLLYVLKRKINEEMMNFAIEEEKKIVEDHPFYYVPYLYLNRLYMLKVPFYPELGEETEEFVKQALEFNNRNPRVWYELGQIRAIRKNYQGAIEAFEEAVRLNPEVSQSIWLLGVAYGKGGQYEKALEYMNKAIEKGYNYQKSIKDIGYLSSTYQKLGRYNKAIEVYKETIEAQPENYQLYISLAATYKAIGDIENAILYAKRAAKIDPGFKDEVEAFIKSLK